MSPRPSNRQALLDGALRCLARMPVDRITARVLAEESGANLASIGYHFGSKDALVTAAVVEGLDRWLRQIAERIAALPPQPDRSALFRQAVEAVNQTRHEHEPVARAFVAALVRGQHDPVVAEHLTAGFIRTRARVAQLLDLGSDGTGTDAGGLMHAMFTGLLVQSLLNEELVLNAPLTETALQRIALALTDHSTDE
ncbi:MAG: TetR/AcrR family transcriptional regulator [Nocardioidaceae bacterium]